MVSVPALYEATLVHRRWQRISRSFQHRIYLWLVDIDKLPTLPRWARPLARFEARDHLGDPEQSIRVNLDEWLTIRGVDLDGGQVLMLANARVLGYTFNPLSVFWCYRRDGTLRCVVAEVHNTYGERHCYLLFPNQDGRAEAAKEFYVSPFLPGHGTYELRLPTPDEKLDISIVLKHDERPVFAASAHGARRRATTSAVLRAALRQPLMPQRVAVLIRRHGIALWFRRVPRNPHTPHEPQEGVQ